MNNDPRGPLRRLTRNAAKCKKCGDVIESRYRHDYRHCKCGAIMVDGGLDYSRRGWPSGDPNDYIEDLCEYAEEPAVGGVSPEPDGG